MSDNGGTEGRDDDCERDDDASDRPVAKDVSLSLDATLELLANHDRRWVLDYLLDSTDGTATIDELVEHLVARKAERTGERPGHDHLLTMLHHVHVPKLADAGVIDYDPRSQEIRYWGDDRLETWHERIRERERDESET